MIGLDSVEIERFTSWLNYSNKSLKKIFHENELAYAFSNSKKTTERLAARFAAKEAFFKAISLKFNRKISLFNIFKNIRVDKLQNGAPFLIVNWKELDLPNLSCFLTITHTDKVASAFVMLNT